MSEQQKILHSLITTGSSAYNPNIPLADINEILGVMSYEAVLWPESKTLILRDLNPPAIAQPPWKEKLIDELKAAIGELCMDKEPRGAVVDLMIQNRWAQFSPEHRLKLTERALVQFEGFISSLDGKYKPCKLCSKLVERSEYHEYCRKKRERNR